MSRLAACLVLAATTFTAGLLYLFLPSPYGILLAFGLAFVVGLAVGFVMEPG